MTCADKEKQEEEKAKREEERRTVAAAYRAVTTLWRPEVDVALCPRGTSCSPCMDLPSLKAAAAESSLATYMRAWPLAFLFFSCKYHTHTPELLLQNKLSDMLLHLPPRPTVHQHVCLPA